jgi:hypothetical protein
MIDFFALIPLKFFTSAKVFFRYPLQSILAVPRNYYRQVFILDIISPPRFYPGSEEIHTTEENWALNIDAYTLFTFYLSVLAEKPRFNVVWLFIIITLPAVLPVISVCFLFRWAIKSTAILWLPLLWIIFQARPGLKVIDRIRVSVETALAKVILAYSTLTLVFFLVKLTPLLAAWWVFNLNWLGPLGIFLTRLVAPSELPLWQVASGINAILAWAFFFRANRHLVAEGTTEEWPERWLQREYVTFQVVRTTLSIYAIICTFYIGAATASGAEWPPIHFILFPSEAGER